MVSGFVLYSVTVCSVNAPMYSITCVFCIVRLAVDIRALIFKLNK